MHAQAWQGAQRCLAGQARSHVLDRKNNQCSPDQRRDQLAAPWRGVQAGKGSLETSLAALRSDPRLESVSVLRGLQGSC